MPTWFDTANRFSDPRGAVRTAQFLAVLDRFPTGHMVDLGAGHGLFSRLAASRGWRVTAVDVRDERFATDEDIRWVKSDIREFDQYDDVDVVACLGLWYHLSLDDQVGLAAKVFPRPLIIDTHVAMPVQDPAHEKRMTPPVTVDGYRGRFYDESDLQDQPTASWGNLQSFWPDVRSLEKQMYDAGYELFEVLSPAPRSDRTFFVATTFGDDKARAALDAAVATVTKLDKPDAAPAKFGTHSFNSFLPADAPKAAPAAAPAATKPAGPAKPAPLGVASKEFARSLAVTARRGAGKAKRAANKQLGK